MRGLQLLCDCWHNGTHEWNMTSSALTCEHELHIRLFPERYPHTLANITTIQRSGTAHQQTAHVDRSSLRLQLAPTTTEYILEIMTTTATSVRLWQPPLTVLKHDIAACATATPGSTINLGANLGMPLTRLPARTLHDALVYAIIFVTSLQDLIGENVAESKAEVLSEPYRNEAPEVVQQYYAAQAAAWKKDLMVLKEGYGLRLEKKEMLRLLKDACVSLHVLGRRAGSGAR